MSAYFSLAVILLGFASACTTKDNKDNPSSNPPTGRTVISSGGGAYHPIVAQKIHTSTATATTTSTATSTSATAAHGTPVPITGGMASPRTYVQTRGMITLNVSDPNAQAGGLLQIFNDTTGTILLATNTPTGAALDDGIIMQKPGLALTASTGSTYTYVANLYPRALVAQRSMFYGPNDLRLEIQGAQDTHEAKSQIYLHDFPLFGFGSATFVGADGKQQLSGYQGRATFHLTPTVSGGGSVMTTGRINLYNQ